MEYYKYICNLQNLHNGGTEDLQCLLPLRDRFTQQAFIKNVQ